jgi:hypothetical protein
MAATTKAERRAALLAEAKARYAAQSVGGAPVVAWEYLDCTAPELADYGLLGWECYARDGHKCHLKRRYDDNGLAAVFAEPAPEAGA